VLPWATILFQGARAGSALPWTSLACLAIALLYSPFLLLATVASRLSHRPLLCLPSTCLNFSDPPPGHTPSPPFTDLLDNRQHRPLRRGPQVSRPSSCPSLPLECKCSESVTVVSDVESGLGSVAGSGWPGGRRQRGGWAWAAPERRQQSSGTTTARCLGLAGRVLVLCRQPLSVWTTQRPQQPALVSPLGSHREPPARPRREGARWKLR